jgi:hypothetical protein
MFPRIAENGGQEGLTPPYGKGNFPSLVAGWSSLVARRAHNPKVAGSNPAPAIWSNAAKCGVRLVRSVDMEVGPGSSGGRARG